MLPLYAFVSYCSYILFPPHLAALRQDGQNDHRSGYALHGPARHHRGERGVDKGKKRNRQNSCKKSLFSNLLALVFLGNFMCRFPNNYMFHHHCCSCYYCTFPFIFMRCLYFEAPGYSFIYEGVRTKNIQESDTPVCVLLSSIVFRSE